MKLSIIIPVYRTEATLHRCIGSVLKQSFTDYELILIDDGSPDNCPRFCDEYAENDKRIVVIHKKNGGLSDARNAGIAIAKGEYLTFVDSDDAIATDTLALLMEELERYPDTDILEYPVMERVGNRKKENLLQFVTARYTDALDYWLDQRAYTHTYAWNKVYRRNLFERVCFPKGKNFEDAITLPRLIGLVTDNRQSQKFPVIRMTNVGMYLYYRNDNGITAKAKPDDIRNLYLAHMDTLLCIFERIGDDENEFVRKYHLQIEDFMLKILNQLLYLFCLTGKFEPKPKLSEYVEWLSKRAVLSLFKLKLFKAIGYRRMCRIYHFTYRFLGRQ